ncbi:MAG: B12-binding domain-containing radical SAM protein [Pseudomonadota bacterium]
MRALLVQPRFAQSFWSFDEALKLLGKKQLVAPLGLITVAALLPQDWELKLVDRSFQDIDDGLWQWADVVMISAMVSQRDCLTDVVREAKHRGKQVVVGGPFASSLPDELVQMGVDFIFQGEAEDGLDSLVQALLDGSPKGVFEERSKQNLSRSPIPRYDLLDLNAYTCMSIQTSRGCPHECEFCDVISLYGRKPRFKDADQIIAELDRLYEMGWSGTVFICDDNFIGHKGHAREFLHRLIPWHEDRSKPFGFWTQATASLGQDLELIDLMTEANFGQIFVGIETPDEEALISIRKRHNVTNPLADSLRSINENGLSVIGSFILGFDGEKKGAGRRICSFIDETHLPQVMVNILQAPPRTALWDRLQSENRLLKGVTQWEIIGGRLNFVPTRPEREILEEYLETLDYLYEPSRYMKRAYEYYLRMRPTRKAVAQKAGNPYPARHCLPRYQRSDTVKEARFSSGLKLFWRQGVVSSCRFQFWRQLIGILRRNPSRVTTYLLSLGFGENLMVLRKCARERIEETLRGSNPQPKALNRDEHLAEESLATRRAGRK